MGPDGSIVFGGTFADSTIGSGASIVKLDSSGNVLWAQFGDFFTNSGGYTWRLRVAPDGSIIWLTQDGNNAVLTALDPSGNRIWQQGISGSAFVFDLAISADSRYLALGGYTGSSSPSPGLLAKLDMATGAPIWSRSISGTAGPNLGSTVLGVDFAPNGDLVATRGEQVASIQAISIVERLDTNGLPLWQRAYRVANATIETRHVVEDAQGDIFTYFEFKRNPGFFFRGMVLQLDSAGNHIANGLLGLEGQQFGLFPTLEELENEGFVLGGDPASNPYSVGLHKQGNAPLCYDSTVIVLDSIVSTPFGNGPSFTSTNLPTTPFTMTFTNGSILSDSTTCFLLGCQVTAAIGASAAQICLGDTLSMTYAGMGSSAFQWKVNGVLSGTGPAFELAPSAAGGYSVVLIASDGACVDSASATFLVNPLPILVPFAWSNNLLAVDFFNQQGGGSLFWDFGDGTTSTTADPSHVFPAPGNYLVCLSLTDGNGCTDSICETLALANVGIDEGFASKVSVFPNPGDGRAKVVWEEAPLGNWELEVVDFMGKSCLVREGVLGKELSLDLRGFSPGAYLIRLKENGSGKGDALIYLMR